MFELSQLSQNSSYLKAHLPKAGKNTSVIFSSLLLSYELIKDSVYNRIKDNNGISSMQNSADAFFNELETASNDQASIGRNCQ